VANENSTFTFSLSGGADQDLFSLDAATGLLTFQTAPVYKVGPGADNTYEVKVRATDNGSPNKFDEQILTVSILDITRPSVIVATTATNPTNLNPIPFTVKFSEPVNGFVLADITVVGGTKGAFTGSGTDYSFIIIPAGNGPVTVHVEANKAFDAANNGNTAANDGTSGGPGGSPGGGGPVEIIYDDVKPTVALSSTAAPVINAPFTVTFTFSEDMTGFAATDITVINGTASALTPVSATEYTALISPIASGQVRVSLAANVAADAAGNGNQASGVLTRTYDNQAPAGYAVAFNQSRIDASNQANASVKVTGAEVGSTYFYTIGSDNGGTPVTGSAIAAAAGFNIAPLNLSGLNDGLLTVSFYQQDALGNKGLVVTATVTKLGKEIALVTNPALIKVPFRTTYAQLTLPAQVEVTYLSGNKEQVGVSWLPGSYNGMAPGIYTLSGNLVLVPGMTNQDNRQAAIQVEVLPNQAPTALMLSNAVFAPDINGLDVTKGLPEAIGAFSTTDADDNLHTYTLVSGTGSTNNNLFEIVDGQLFLKSNKGLYGLKTFEIRVRTTDPYRNTFEQTFIITKGKYLKGTMEIVNAFTPNGDGINDTWVIPELRFYDNVEIEVFDRAGVRLFHTTNPEQGWNGRTRNGQELKGPFLFMLQIKDINFVKKGTVTVLKRD
jgi:gliding motility-associated-like protein